MDRRFPAQANAAMADDIAVLLPGDFSPAKAGTDLAKAVHEMVDPPFFLLGEHSAAAVISQIRPMARRRKAVASLAKQMGCGP